MKRILMIHPRFAKTSFWNYTEVCELVGTKYPSPPLGLITLAALLPKEWEIKLLDLNVAELDPALIDWASLVFIGGMLPQQAEILSLIQMVHGQGKKVVVGGPDPTSQPEVYSKADYLVLGEAESAIHPFLEDLETGKTSGTYRVEEKPDMSLSPIPRFDLLNFNNYMGMGLQFCRGCPYNCEFCDIIELFGRKTRSKSNQQILDELQTLYDLGYRGEISFVDDNFIGNKGRVKSLLRDVLAWSQSHKFPFYFSTEVSINLADDEELLELMEAVDFRNVFIGIESAEDSVLSGAQKKQNINRTLQHNLLKINSYGMIVTGGFIIGFDDETDESVKKMEELITGSTICIPMVGLLYALPNTQLTRRLEREKRLFSNSGRLGTEDVVDQASSGINFVTLRAREEILSDYKSLLQNIFSPKNFFNRCLKLRKDLHFRPKSRLPLRKSWRYGLAFLKIGIKLGLEPKTFYYFWRNTFFTLFTKPSNIVPILSMMAMYIHLKKHATFITDLIQHNLAKLNLDGKIPPPQV